MTVATRFLKEVQMESSKSHRILKEETFARLPGLISTGDLFPQVQEAVRRSARKVVVLDDDYRCHVQTVSEDPSAVVLVRDHLGSA